MKMMIWAPAPVQKQIPAHAASVVRKKGCAGGLRRLFFYGKPSHPRQAPLHFFLSCALTCSHWLPDYPSFTCPSNIDLIGVCARYLTKVNQMLQSRGRNVSSQSRFCLVAASAQRLTPSLGGTAPAARELREARQGIGYMIRTAWPYGAPFLNMQKWSTKVVK